MMKSPRLELCSPRHRFWILVRKIGIGVLTTRSDKGVLTSRQVTACNGKNDTGPVLRFEAAADSLWLRDIAGDPHVSLVYADSVRGGFLAISGNATVRRGGSAKTPYPWSQRHISVVEVQVASAFLNDDAGQLAIASSDFVERIKARERTGLPAFA